MGRFEILDVLGQGGFNRVFLARDPRLDRLVALKVPRPSAIADEASRRRFQREATAAAVLGHPAIVPIFEAGTAGPITYIAFGYCDGQTLSQWFAEQDQTVDPAEAARIVARLAEATEHAHQRGVIHRDLKPANVLITQQRMPWNRTCGFGSRAGRFRRDMRQHWNNLTLGVVASRRWRQFSHYFWYRLWLDWRPLVGNGARPPEISGNPNVKVKSLYSKASERKDISCALNQPSIK